MQKLAFIFMAAPLIANVLCEWSSLNVPQKYLQAIEEGKRDKYIGAKGIRHFLHTYGLYSVDEDVQQKIAVSLSEFLRESDDVETEIEAVYALSIFADRSLERAQMIINTGVVPDLIKILHSSDNDKLVWVTLMVFANLMKGNPNQRDYCINQGLVPILIKIGFETSESAVRNGVAVTIKMQKLAFIFMAAHLIANVLCEWSSLSHSQKYLQAIEEGKHDKYIGAKGIRHFLQTLGLYSVDENVQEKIAASLSKFLRENDGVETEIEAVYALSIFADGSLERAQMVVNTGVVPNLIKILHLSDDDKLVWVTLMVFANLMKGHPNQRDYCINQGLVPILIKIGFETSESAVRNGVAVTMYSICQDRPDIPIDIIAKLLPSLKDF
uniref:Uncharacterized protein n=1 Tax=Panagrolaimus sp. ES5 TaxID=591445 RepID=A0AC34FRE1_9BILA